VDKAPRIRRIHASISPEQARDTRARAWAFVFQCWQAKQMGGCRTAPNDAERSSSDDATRSISR
jgi:hypothetical protein